MVPSRAMSLAVLVSLLLSLPVGAVAPVRPVSVRLDLQADPGCTSRSELVARVAARSARLQFVDDARFAAQAVFTTPRPGDVVAELVLTPDDGTPSVRRVVGRTCAEAVDAVALILAITFDPTTTRKPTTNPLTDNQDAVDVETVQPPPATKPAAQAALLSSPNSTVARRRFGAYLAGQTLFGPAPAVMPGIAIYAMVATERDGPWSPGIVLGATHVGRGGLSERGGTAAFTLDAASLDGCLLRGRLYSLEARACASVLLGRLTASGTDTDAPASAARFFGAVGGTVILTAGLGRIVELSVRLGTGVTLVRDAFAFTPTVFHRANALTTSASLGIGARWW
jgi:hypothetical protein